MKSKCCKCKKEKNFSEFRKNKSKKNGYSNDCKDCHSEYRKKKYKENKEKELTQVRNYQSKHPEKYVYSLLNEEYRHDKKRGDAKYRARNSQNKISKKAGRIYSMGCGVCGEEVFVTQTDLQNKKINYCSIECRSITFLDDYDYALKEFEKRSKKKELNFDLDKQFLIDLLENKQDGKCAITKVPIEMKGKKEKAVLYKSASLDRIDSNKGYMKDNVQWVMLGVNYMKLNFPEEDLHKALVLIKENYRPLV